MPQQFRMLLAVGLSLFVIYGWYAWVAPPQKTVSVDQRPSPTEVQPPTSATPPVAKKAEPVKKINDPQSVIAETRTMVTTDLFSAELSSVGAVPKSWALLKYLVTNGNDHPVDLVAHDHPPLQLAGDLLADILPADAHFTVDQPDPLRVVYRWRGNGVEVTKSYTFHQGSYLVDLAVTVRNLGSTPLQGSIALDWNEKNSTQKQGGFLSFLKGPPNVWEGIYYLEGKVNRVTMGQDPIETQVAGRLYWGGLENRYYLAAVMPRSQTTDARALLKAQPMEGNNELRAVIGGAPLTIAPGQDLTETFSLYAGPKQLEALKAAGLHLDKAIDYGWFGFVAIPILYLLKLFYALVHNYGVAIILLTLFIKLLLHPVSKASMRSMKKMQLLQPRLKELREKYKGDPQRLNMETMQLFKTHGVNPMGGCLPMVLQIPIYIALYKVLWNAIELYRAPFFGFYRDLSAPDPYFIAPILLGVAFFLQQRLTPSPTTDPAQQKIMMIMPVMFTAFMVFLPAGLVIYIFVNTLFTVLQQWLMNRGLGFRDLLRGNVTPKPL